ncbi:MAG: type I 3-dehydroquinate dehydratase [Phycisphaerae bacterium]|nr:type I 3-dehydroquinate dehydratase [Phycisphaerae bacterium]
MTTSDRKATRLICSLTASDAKSMRADMLAAAKAGADAVECRLDYLRPIPDAVALKALLAGHRVDVIATCRAPRQGGQFAGSESQRLDVLRHAAKAGATFVDVEDDVPVADWPKGRVICSFHDMAGRPDDLGSIARRLDASPAEVNKLAVVAGGPEDALAALEVLRACRKPTIALAMGEAGAASRILARKFCAVGTFASLHPGAESAAGQFTLQEMRELVRWDSLSPATSVYGVIGCPVAHSMSPAIHNAAFTAAGLDAVYVPLLIQPGEGHFRRFMDALVARPWLDWRGLSVTIPHKENALAYVGAGNCDGLARQIGAVNTITLRPDGLRGDNTDYSAALEAMCVAMGIRREALAASHLAVLGAGGVARAIVAGLRHYRAEVTVYNRTVARAEALGREFACHAAGLADIANTTAEILIHCTPIGMHPKVDACPLATIPPQVKVVFDAIYNPPRTRLLEMAETAGCKTVSGVEMFVNQAVAQYQAWTGRPAPRQVMRDVVLARLADR